MGTVILTILCTLGVISIIILLFKNHSGPDESSSRIRYMDANELAREYREHEKRVKK